MTLALPAVAKRVRPQDIAGLFHAVKTDFGRLSASEWDPRHHLLLDALDRGESHRFVAVGGPQYQAVAHLSGTGAVSVAGDVACAPALSGVVERSGWQVLIGSAPLAEALLAKHRQGFAAIWKSRPNARIQRFMARFPETTAEGIEPLGIRTAVRDDLDIVTEFACKLHVEDRMGPPLQGRAVDGMTVRMGESIDRGLTFVVNDGDTVIGKADLSLYSKRWGAQISGVYVDDRYRGQGVGTAMVSELSQWCFNAEMSVVSLHVRDDNVGGIRAYEKAGFVQLDRWLLALR